MSIFELNKIMACICLIDAGQVRTTVAESMYNGTHYSEQTSDFGDVQRAALCFGLLDLDGDNLSVTDNGAVFVKMMKVRNGKKMLNGTDEQRKFLIRCLDVDRMYEECSDMFKKFHVNYSNDPPMWNSNAREFGKFESYMLGIFEEIGFISRDRNIVSVGMENVETFSSIKNGLRVCVDDLSYRKQEIGGTGEIMTMDYEMKRLADMGRSDLSDMVKQVSVIDPYAGYDIASFETDSSDGSHHDRLIEVKSTTGTKPRFFWSRNEVSISRKCNDRYWIYLWTDVEGSAILHMIQNPYTELFNTGNPKPEPSVYVVDKSVLAHAHVDRGSK